MGTPSTNFPWYDYSVWVKNIGRNSRITPVGYNGDAVELTAVRNFIKYIWDPMTQTGTRPWLQAIFQRKAVQVPTDVDYQCDIDQQPAHVLSKLVEIIGRDFKKIPLTDKEGVESIVLQAKTNSRFLGVAPYYGGVAGSNVTIP